MGIRELAITHLLDDSDVLPSASVQLNQQLRSDRAFSQSKYLQPSQLAPFYFLQHRRSPGPESVQPRVVGQIQEDDKRTDRRQSWQRDSMRYIDQCEMRDRRREREHGGGAQRTREDSE